jgi:acyl-CoA thioester hydrolase
MMNSVPHETRIRVRYAETDQMGVVHHANYYVWMELARVEWCDARGFSYRDMEKETGVFLAVVETGCRYLRPAHFDDRVCIRTIVEAANTRVARFGYEIHRCPDNQLLATGFTKHLYVSRGPNGGVSDEMRGVRLPEKYRPLFGIE